MDGGAAVLKARAAVPMRTASIQAAQKMTGIRSTTRTVVAAMRVKCFALIVPLDCDHRVRSFDASPVRRLTLTPFRACVKGVRSASHAIATTPRPGRP